MFSFSCNVYFIIILIINEKHRLSYTMKNESCWPEKVKSGTEEKEKVKEGRSGERERE